eukprot:7288111-Karenia_brevis.AAC.1
MERERESGRESIATPSEQGSWNGWNKARQELENVGVRRDFYGELMKPLDAPKNRPPAADMFFLPPSRTVLGGLACESSGRDFVRKQKSREQ